LSFALHPRPFPTPPRDDGVHRSRNYRLNRGIQALRWCNPGSSVHCEGDAGSGSCRISSWSTAGVRTGAAPVEFTDHLGGTLRDGCFSVHNTLGRCQSPRQKIRLAVQLQDHQRFRLHSIFAIGRLGELPGASMFCHRLASIAKLPHQPLPPCGDAGQVRQRALGVPDKARRAIIFTTATSPARAEMLAAGRLKHPNELGPHHLFPPGERDGDKNYLADSTDL